MDFFLRFILQIKIVKIFFFQLRFLLDGGAMIGWYRNKAMIPYDDDIDVTVRLDVWTSPEFMEVMNVFG